MKKNYEKLGANVYWFFNLEENTFTVCEEIYEHFIRSIVNKKYYGDIIDEITINLKQFANIAGIGEQIDGCTIVVNDNNLIGNILIEPIRDRITNQNLLILKIRK